MNILALDPSSSCTGWTLCIDGVVTKAGFSPPFEGETEGERYAVAYAWLDSLIRRLNTPLDLILMEGYFFSKRFATGTSVSVELRGVLKLLLHGLGLKCEIVDPAGWKRALIDAATPKIVKDLDYPRVRSDQAKIARWKKSLKRKYGKEKSKKMITLMALQKLYNIEFPTTIMNRTTNRRVNFKFDVSDAIGILVGHFMSKGPTLFNFNIEWDFEVVND